MNLRQLRTLAEFLEHGSLAAVGDRVGLSHSAVSVQMKQLEKELGVDLFDRRSKPLTMTPMGAQIGMLATDVISQVDNIRALAAGRSIAGSVAIGFVPTTLQTLLPRVLVALRQAHPQLQVIAKSGLSSELATAVTRRELDYAIITSPAMAVPELNISEIAAEPLYVIGPASQASTLSDAALARSLPFITFSKKTGLGQQIAARLQARGIFVNEIMEVDSLDSIETLVEDGFGVAIVPQRLLAKSLSTNLTRVPFCDPPETRKLVLIQTQQTAQTALGRTITKIATTLPEQQTDS